MRFTVTIEAPEGANALQGLANLPEGWRVVEFREMPQPPKSLADYLPTIGLSNPKDAFAVSPLKDGIPLPGPSPDAQEFLERQRRSRPVCDGIGIGDFAPSPIHGASIGKAIVSGGLASSVGFHPAVPPDTIVGLNHDGTIAGSAKVDTEAKA